MAVVECFQGRARVPSYNHPRTVLARYRVKHKRGLRVQPTDAWKGDSGLWVRRTTGTLRALRHSCFVILSSLGISPFVILSMPRDGTNRAADESIRGVRFQEAHDLFLPVTSSVIQRRVAPPVTR